MDNILKKTKKFIAVLFLNVKDKTKFIKQNTKMNTNSMSGSIKFKVCLIETKMIVDRLMSKNKKERIIQNNTKNELGVVRFENNWLNSGFSPPTLP